VSLTISQLLAPLVQPGNVGNTLTAVARLGLPCALLTKLGTDANGKLILAGLQEEGIDTSPVVTSAATPSPFTYIIVDKSEATRTCIHTAMTEELLPSDVTPAVLQGAALLHCDARMTQVCNPHCMLTVRPQRVQHSCSSSTHHVTEIDIYIDSA
jgi:pfkB family carbohydrate kinase